jgi:hypothetical protein
MSLDFLIEGVGFDTSAAHINHDASVEDAIVTGISDWSTTSQPSMEMTGYPRLTCYHQDGSVEDCNNGFEIKSMDRSQVDFSGSYRLPVLEEQNLMLTFDAYNLTDEPSATGMRWRVSPTMLSIPEPLTPLASWARSKSSRIQASLPGTAMRLVRQLVAKLQKAGPPPYRVGY